MGVRTVATGAGAAAVAVCAALVGAPSATAQGAPITWYQSVARASVDAPCPINSASDTGAGWSPWTGSWEEWPHGGTGGYVCTRAITWAYDADVTAGTYPSGGCVFTGRDFSSNDHWAQFGGGWSLPSGTRLYLDAGCVSQSDLVSLKYNTVYAPGSADPDALCRAAWGEDALLESGDDVWACRNAT